MGIFFFYNNRKPRKFEHKPIYWDPKKEALEKRKENARNGMVPQERRISFPRKSKKRNNRNLWIVLLLIILLLMWYLFD